MYVISFIYPFFVVILVYFFYFPFAIQFVCFCNRAKIPSLKSVFFQFSQRIAKKSGSSASKIIKFFFLVQLVSFCSLVFLNILSFFFFFFSWYWPRIFDAGKPVSMCGVCTDSSRESTRASVDTWQVQLILRDLKSSLPLYYRVKIIIIYLFINNSRVYTFIKFNLPFFVLSHLYKETLNFLPNYFFVFTIFFIPFMSMTGPLCLAICAWLKAWRIGVLSCQKIANKNSTNETKKFIN